MFESTPGLARVALEKGLSIEVDTQDWNGRMVYLFGSADPKIVAVCQGLLRSGDVLLDIGANIGTIGLKCHESVLPNGSVHLFEPQPQMSERIAYTIESENLQHVFLHPIGLFDKDDEIEMQRPLGHSGAASIVHDITQSESETLTITVKDISTYVPPLVGGRKFGVKLDIEGAEIYLLPWLFAQTNLRFVVFECNQELDKLWLAITKSNLVIYGIRKSLFFTELQRIWKREQLEWYYDVVGVRLAEGAKPKDRITPRKLHQFLPP